MRRITFSIAVLLLAGLGLAQATDTTKIDKVVVEKVAHTLTLFSQGRVVKTYRVAIGVGAPGQDQRRRRSHSRRQLRHRRRNTRSEFHRSLHISYPDADDGARARKAGKRLSNLIAIHGTPDWIERIQDGGEHPDWTAGCIAVRKTEIEELYALVPVGTPIEIKP